MQIKGRSYLRIKTSIPVSYQKATGEYAYHAEIVDLSAKGAGFCNNEVLQKEERVSVKFYLPGQWRLINFQAEVKNQIEGVDIKKEYRYLTGVQFANVDPSVLKRITNYIVKKVNATFKRWFVLLLGIVASLLFLTRGLYFAFINIYTGSPFGNEWVAYPWSSEVPKIAAAVHILLAFGLIVSCFAFFLFKKRSYLFVLLFSFIGVITQLVRLVLKFSFLFEDYATRYVFIYEAVSFSIFLVLFIFVVRTGRSLNSVLEFIDKQLQNY